MFRLRLEVLLPLFTAAGVGWSWLQAGWRRLAPVTAPGG
jgi:hypothetical protein